MNSPPKEPHTEGSFAAESHPAYSSFSHIEGLANLAFSVGLREDGGTDDVVSKIIPMARIVPGVPIERRIRSMMEDVGGTDLEAAALEIPEYVELQDRLRELTAANANLRQQIDDIEAQMKITLNKQAIAERNSKTIETTNDKLSEELDDVKSRTAILQVEAEETARENGELRAQVDTKQTEISKLEAQIALARHEIDKTTSGSTVEVIFARNRRAAVDDETLATEVKSVPDRYDSSSSGFIHKKDKRKGGMAGRLPSRTRGPGR